MKRLLLTLLLLLPFCMVANDGVYYANGNHLIPITETDISVRKEVLTITRVCDQFHVDVYYEFYNPGKAKDLLVGFEAADPYPCYDPAVYEKALPNHPFIYDFTVEMNSKHLAYEVAHVDYFKPSIWKERAGLPEYYRNGNFQTIDVREYLDTLRNSEYYGNAGICYAYHFNAHFQPGLNIIHHTYRYQASVVAGYSYYLSYVLTAANRWANHQIDDFTLILDMGDHQSFYIPSYFFDSLSEWQIQGAGRMNERPSEINGMKPTAMFHVRHGKVLFHKTDFHPLGELDLYRPVFYQYFYQYSVDEIFNACREGYNDYWYLPSKKDSFTPDQRRILRNLPFAQRGYCFKNAALQAFYNSTDWYVPDSTYVPDLETLPPDERKWIQFWSE